jgi:predicted amidohydrolase YtcJ
MPPGSTPQIFRARAVLAPGASAADALGVAAGRVLAVGALDDVREAMPKAPVTDFGGAVIAPGFNDAHLHLAIAADDLLGVDVSPAVVASLAELTAKIGAAASRTAYGGWVRASGYDDARMPDTRMLTRGELDEATGPVPALVVHVAGHWAVANSAALAAAGLDDDAVPPPGGDFGRDGAGRLNGVLYERALQPFDDSLADSDAPSVVPPYGLEDRLRALADVLRRWHAAGLTSVCDAFTRPQDLKLFAAADERGLLTMRTGFLLTVEHYDLAHRLGLRSGFGDDRLRFVGVKTILDGAIGGRTCLLDEPIDAIHGHGIQALTESELTDQVRAVHGDGNRIGIHANGDRAIRIALDALSSAQRQRPRPGLRHRIEHCSVVDDDILRRMAALGAIAVPFGNYVRQYGGRLIDWYGDERVSRMFAHRSFLDRGIAVAGSSDYPCSAVEPLSAMQAMVTRVGLDGAEVGTQQRISPAEALGVYTTGSATATGEEGVKGALLPGQLADFVVLDESPLDVQSDRIAAIDVLATYVGGECVSRHMPI